MKRETLHLPAGMTIRESDPNHNTKTII